MKTHVAQLAKQRISDFFVKEEGHVAHKNALVAGAVITGAILGSLMLAPEAGACTRQIQCGNFVCWDDKCCTSSNGFHEWQHCC